VRRARERGVVLVVVALCLTVLMIFAAFAVDFGAARTARRKGQATVDGGTLAGGQLLVSDTGELTGADPDDVADEVIEVTHLNLTSDGALSDAGSLTLDEWRSRFTSCTDPERDIGRFPTTSSVSDCISFNTQMTRIRVRLPDLNVGTYFANVIGIDSLDVHAVAEADLVAGRSGGVLPFGLLGGTSGPEVCLRTGSQPELPPCTGPSSGNFDSVNVRFFGNPVLGTPEMCTGEEPLRLAVNIAQGIDHRMSEYGAGPALHDGDACADLSLHPNRTDGRPGVTAQTLDEGLVVGIEETNPDVALLGGHPIPGRLANGPWLDGATWATREARSHAPILDDVPLWTFIDSALAAPSIPDLCDQTITPIDDKSDMTACLSAFTDGGYTTPLFTADIVQSPRLAWVPQFEDTEWGEGRKDYNIRAFRPVFLQTLYFACPPSPCPVFDPGESGIALPAPRNSKAEALTALLLPDAALPQAVHDAGPTGPATYDLVLRR